MAYPLVLIWIFGALFALYLLFEWWRWRRAAALRRTLETMPFPETWREALHRTPHYGALDERERERIERAVLRFVHTCDFTGVQLEVTEAMKATVAFYGCLMVLHKPGEWFEELHNVILYAEDFVYDDAVDYGGIVSKGPQILDGQSSHDTVVLSWEVAAREAYARTPDNVIIHEFSHVLDYLDGQPDGVPPMAAEHADTWEGLIALYYDTLVASLQSDAPDERFAIFPEDAALDEAEFFAVCSELYFQAPRELYANLPELFETLQLFYGGDPRRWELGPLLQPGH